MDSVIIVAPYRYDAELKERLSACRNVTEGADGTLVVGDGRTSVYLSRNGSVRQELEPERLQRITATIQEPIFYTVDFSDIGLCREVLLLLVNDPKLLVDNDHGVMLPGPEFVRVLRSQQDWDWRQDPT
jgi:hypothetical protein